MPVATIGRVTIEPGNSVEPTRMRASNDDREQVARTLNTAMAEGRLTPVELAERLDQVYAARTLGDSTTGTLDVPPSTVARPAETPGALLVAVDGTEVVGLTVGTMTSAFALNVPLEVNIALGPTWADAKS